MRNMCTCAHMQCVRYATEDMWQFTQSDRHIVCSRWKDSATQDYQLFLRETYR